MSWQQTVGGALVVALALLPADVSAQSSTTGSIAGVVRDATGAVVPGVTIEASSPALIEKARTVVSDNQGQYRIVELRPGTYSVTFQLAGFNTVQRDGIELTTGFTATVNAEMRLGSLQETVTVSGASPIVDTQNVLQQAVITRDVLDVIPTGKSFWNVGILVPGATVTGTGRLDVGGSSGYQVHRIQIHGSRTTDQIVQVDGMSIGVQETAGAFADLNFPEMSVQEFNFGIGAHLAETEVGGVRVNIVPRSGSNVFKGSALGSYSSDNLNTTNLDDDLKAQGLTAVDRIRYISEVNGSLGGPISRDRLWFFTGYRNGRRASDTTRYFDANSTDWIYTEDRSRGNVPLDQFEWAWSGRLTWQVSSKDTVNATFAYDDRCDCTGRFASLEVGLTAGADARFQTDAKMGQVTWSRPVTSRLLLEAGFSRTGSRRHSLPLLLEPPVPPGALELNGNLWLRSRVGNPGANEGYHDVTDWNAILRASASYVTGTHALKFGLSLSPNGNWSKNHRQILGDYLVVLLNGIPNRAEYFATPYRHSETVRKLGVFVQDQLTIKRLTLNAGLRLDTIQSSYDAVELPATNLLPPRQFPGAEVVDWKDLSPRLGAAYDVFGTGKTALKIAANRYVVAESINLARTVSPVVTSSARLARAWFDLNGDFVPQGDPLNPMPNGELIGPSTNVNFGKPVTTLRYDPEWAYGWGVRGYNWEFSGGIEHELLPRVGATANYFRRRYGNLTVTDNVLVAPSDYDPFCITPPRDSRLPDGGGQQICDLYDITPSKVGALDRVQGLASKYGDIIEYWHGMDLTIDARFPNAALLQGGVSIGRTITDNCDVVTQIDNPSQQYCHRDAPFLANIKLLGAYTLPKAIQVSGTFQSIPGNDIAANYVARNAEILPSLGRNLAAGPNSTVTVNIVEPGIMQSDRINQLDLRIARHFTIGRGKLNPMLDLYNALNSNPVAVLNQTYGTTGATWLAPQQVLLGRVLKVGVQVDF